MSEKKVILKTEALSHLYGADTPFEKVALDNINLEIYENDFLAVIGQTGSGKSTLVQHFNAINKPTSGKFLYMGDDVWQKGYNRRDLRFNVGMVFQYPEHQLFEETVRKDISYGPENMGLPAEEINSRVLEAIKFVGLDEYILEKSPFELSGGQKRRVAIAGVMAMRPRILILDEPTAGLDPKGRDDILAGIKYYHDTTGAAVVLVSHSMEDVAHFASRVAVMHQGKLVMCGTKEEIFSNSETLVSIGLDVPQITRILMALNREGYSFDTSVYTVEGVAVEIVKYLNRK